MENTFCCYAVVASLDRYIDHHTMTGGVILFWGLDNMSQRYTPRPLSSCVSPTRITFVLLTEFKKHLKNSTSLFTESVGNTLEVNG